MKVLLAILLNAGLLAWLLPWLRRQWQQTWGWVRAALVLGLGARLAIAAATGRHLVRDAHYLSDFGTLLSDQLWAEPLAALHGFWGNEVHFGGYRLVYHGMSNTYFFAKIVAVLNLASLTTTWVNALYFSLFSFVGAWQLAKTVGRIFPQTPAAAGMAFLLWPSVVFWSSGITKEAVVLGSGTWLVAVFVTLAFGTAPLAPARRAGLVGAGLLLALLHFKMRYFFAVPLLAALAGLAGVQLLQRLGVVRARWAQALVLAAVLGAGAWLVPQLSPAFRLNKFTHQVVTIYEHNLSLSLDKPHFEYPHLRPTLESVVRHAPLAAANALTRPWLGESAQPLYLVAALENAALLLGLGLAAWAVVRGRPGRLPFGLTASLLVFCLVLAFLIGITTPNLGTLHRYRSGLLPYLLLLLLQNDYAAAGMRRLGLR